MSASKQIGLPTKPEWAGIEAEARAEAMAFVDAERATVPEFGTFVVWALRRDYGGVTSGFSPVHRVGVPVGGTLYTTCHEAIPDAILRLPLSPALVRSMEHCAFCEANTTQQPLSHVA